MSFRDFIPTSHDSDSDSDASPDPPLSDLYDADPDPALFESYLACRRFERFLKDDLLQDAAWKRFKRAQRQAKGAKSSSSTPAKLKSKVMQTSSWATKPRSSDQERQRSAIFENAVESSALKDYIGKNKNDEERQKSSVFENEIRSSALKDDNDKNKNDEERQRSSVGENEIRSSALKDDNDKNETILRGAILGDGSHFTAVVRLHNSWLHYAD